MSDQCATCGAADVILFTCGYCGGTFCADHDLPHHSCEGFAHPGEGVDEVAFEWETEGHTEPDTGADADPAADTGGDADPAADTNPDPEDAFTASGFRPATGGAEAATRSRTPRPAPETTTRAVEPVPRQPGGDATAAAVHPRPRQPEGDTTAAVRPVPRSTAADATPAVERVPRRVARPTTPAVTPAPRRVEPAIPAIERAPRATTGATAPAVRPTPRRPARPTERAIRAVPAPGPEPEPAPGAAPSGGATTSEATGLAAAEAATAATPSDSSGGGPIRAMDAKRSPGRVERHEPRTLTEWLDQQTYVSLSVKTAALATVINGALYLGMVVTLYGLLPV